MKTKTSSKATQELIPLIEKGHLKEIISRRLPAEKDSSNPTHLLSHASLVLYKKIQHLKGILNGSVSKSINTDQDDIFNNLSKDLLQYIQDTKRASQTAETVLTQEREKLNQEDWIKSEISSLFTKIQGIKTKQELGDLLLTTISASIGAQVSAFYCTDLIDGNMSDVKKMVLVASYGFDPDSVKKEFVLGEGIIGQCALDKQIRHITNLPTSFQKVNTGVGEIPLSSVYVCPIIFEGVVYAVVEFMSIKNFSDVEVRFLNRINRSIGITIKSIISFMHNEHLLKEIEKTNNSLASQKNALDSAAIVAETDLRGRITYVNDKFIEISKYREEELIGQDHRILNSGFHSKEFFVNLWKTISSGKTWHGEVRNRAKDGSIYWVDTTIYPVKDENGVLQKFVAIRFDITTKKEALEALQEATETAKAAARLKAEFLAIMSHEIRTPMNAIVGMTDILKDTTLDSDQSRFVNTLSQASESLLDVINSILDISKLEAGNVAVESVDFDIEELVTTTCGILSTSAQKKGLEFNCYISSEIPSRLIGDPVKIKQTLINLISNAIKFTKSGEVFIKVEQTSPCSDIIEFSVRDSGIGVPPEAHDRLFKSFSQASTSTTIEYGGTGLGLSISKKLVEVMGGTIGFESTPNQGSRFFFMVPLQKATNSVLIKEKASVVNDNKEVYLYAPPLATHRLLKKTLVEHGAKVNSLHAIEDLKSTQCDTLIYSVQDTKSEVDMNRVIEGTSISKVIIIHNSCEQILLKSTSIENLQMIYLNKPFCRGELVSALEFKEITESDKVEIEPQKALVTTVDAKNKIKILAVDDVQANLDVITAYLQGQPVEVVQAKNGEDALTKYQNSLFDIILMDLQMPVMDGRSATQKIRAIETEQKARPTVILALSAHAGQAEIEQSLQAGCNGHLIKPIRKKALIDALFTHANLKSA